MRYLFGVFGILFSIHAMAGVDGIGGNYLFSHDTDDNTTHRVSLTGWATPQFGILASKAVHHTNVTRAHSEAVEAAVDYTNSSTTIRGTAGVGQINSHQYFSGDITLTQRILPSVHVNVGAFGDLVDSTNGLTNSITMKGITGGAEYMGDRWGVAGSVKRVGYTNGNTQVGTQGKLYKDVADGVNVFASYKQLDNSLPNNGDFWSPDKYHRVGVGAGIRAVMSSWNFAGYADIGRATADGDTQPALSIKGSASKSWYSWSTKITIGAENTDGTRYRYQYINANLYKAF